MANSDAQLAQKTIAPTSMLPIYAFAMGAALTAAILGADLLGLSALLGEDSMLKSNFIWSGLAIMAVSALTDFTFGQRFLLAWLKSIVSDWQGLLKFAAIAVQLGLLTAIMRMSYLEHQVFYHNVMLLTLYGFVIHYFLPQAFRLPFFILLSLGGIFGVFGLADGAWLIVISLALIGLCHLPVRFGLRVAIVLLAGAALFVMRIGFVQTPWNKAIWPILASMFMFRMIIYLYDLKHKKVQPGGITRTLAYFFLLPNIAFPLFPVVDYSTFCRTYYNEDQYRIYQTGLRWMFWGAVHLLIYRYINYYWVIAPVKVHTTAELVQYLVSNYLFFIRLTGEFHLIVGILHMFGFNLPRIMDNFLLSSGFTDYWRRVNVYWKDFIQKVFYFPVYFKMRNFGNTTKLVLATSLGIFMTWSLHAYQWFWIRGSFVFTAPDMLFWTGIGVFVLANSLYEAKYGRKRSLVKRAASLGEIVMKTLRAASLFVAMSFLWSLWISSSLSEWALLYTATDITLSGILTSIVLIIAVLGVAMFVYEKWVVPSGKTKKAQPSFFRLALPFASAILLLYIVIQPEFSHRLGNKASHLIADLKTNRLNDRDVALLERGYYEGLTNVSMFNPELAELYENRPDDWLPLVKTRAVRETHDFLRYELLPMLDGSFKDAPFKTNRWGMRDQDYEQTPPPNTFRIAMLGGSVEMGSGVVHEETFDYILEKRLNEKQTGRKYEHFELLNFAVGGYHILQQLITLEKKVFDFKPNAIIVIAHTSEEGRLFFKSPLTPKKIDPDGIPYDGLREFLYRAGIKKKTRANKVARRLEPYNYDIMFWAYSRVVEQCRQRDILPIWACLPTKPGINDSTQAVPLVNAAEKAGFIVLNLTNVYDSAKGAYLQVAPWDKHPNARGHQLIADGLYEAFLRNGDRIPFGLSATTSNGSAGNIE